LGERFRKLWHDRGPVFTVPFNLLGAVENMSRDWVIDKIAIGITYDSDLNLAKKLIRQIGRDLQKAPELGPLIRRFTKTRFAEIE
jgi:small-conductance mechanosensitive channel